MVPCMPESTQGTALPVRYSQHGYYWPQQWPYRCTDLEAQGSTRLFLNLEIHLL